MSTADDRFYRQGAKALGAAGLTIAAALLARRSVRARVYRPHQFQANHIPPKFNMTKDAAHAMLDASLLSTGFFAFGIFAVFWTLDVSSLTEFGEKMQAMLGGAENRLKMADQVDPAVDESISSWFKKSS